MSRHTRTLLTMGNSLWRQVRRGTPSLPMTRAKGTLAPAEILLTPDDALAPVKPTPITDYSAIQSLQKRFHDLQEQNRYSQISKLGPGLIDELEEAVKLDPNNLALIRLLGNACTLYGKTKVTCASKAGVDEAIRCLRRAVELDPNNREAYDTLQWELMLRGEPSTMGVIHWGLPRDPLDGWDGTEEEAEDAAETTATSAMTP